MALRRAIRAACAVVVTTALLAPLTGCSPGSNGDADGNVTWRPATADVTREPAPAATPPSGALAIALTADQIQAHRPNELGAIPVIQYHVITTDESAEADPFVRTAAHMREDLQWLYDNGFYVITTREFLENRISAPPGKRPVILTFDDSTASQFRWADNGNDVSVIDPDSAVGVLEAFFQEHPDFGRGGQFAVLRYNCFADGTPLNTLDDCPDKLRWLAANGYEIVNHTDGHQDLLDVTNVDFAYQVGEPMIWLGKIIEGDANLMDVLVMPYGNYPSRDLHPEQREMMRNGFTYEGQEVLLQGAFMVGANPTESPSSSDYDPLFIARVQANETSLDQWFRTIEDGDILVYVSDGNPDTITIPDPAPDSLADEFDADTIAAKGHQLIRYVPASGEPQGAETIGWRKPLPWRTEDRTHSLSAGRRPAVRLPAWGWQRTAREIRMRY